MRVAGLPSSDVRYFFPGRRRKMQVCVQGEFKRRVRFDKVLNGQEFARPPRLPARRVVEWAFGLVKHKLPATFRHDFFGPRPYFLSPLAAASARPPRDARLARALLLEALAVEVALLPEGGGRGRPGHVVLRPEIAALSMSGSSFIVAVNALLLKRLHLPVAAPSPEAVVAADVVGAAVRAEQ